MEDWTGGMNPAQLVTLHEVQYSPNTPKSILAHMEMTRKENTVQVHGEYAKSILPCSLYMPIDINLSLSRQLINHYKKI
jgi:hypothetical protein